MDLIYLDRKKQAAELEKEYQARITSWTSWVNHKLDAVVDGDLYPEEQAEYFMVNNFLKNLLHKRFEWICRNSRNDTIKVHYLQALPPFNQQGRLKSMLLHFFQLKELKDQDWLSFDFISHSERELRVLWDIYKLTKTLETIEVIRSSIASVQPFPSIFKDRYAINLLNTLSSALQLLITMFVKPEYKDLVLHDFPMSSFEPEAILYRKEKERYFVRDSVLERLDYRNYIFHIYYRPGFKVKANGNDHSFSYNYLDYEIIRQEFLIHWVYRRLQKNPSKNEILERYRIGNKTFNDVIEASRGSELYVLKQLPKEEFERLISDVNETVSEEERLPFDPMSERFGDFSKKLLMFESAKKLAKRSIATLKKWFAKKQTSAMDAEVTLTSKADQSEEVSEEEKDAVRSHFNIEILSREEISFPFFCTVNSQFSRRQALIRAKMQPGEFLSFSEHVKEIIQSTDEQMLIKRRTPRHEWSIPFLFHDMRQKGTGTHLLILGAEAKNQHLSMGYGSGFKESYDLKPYFVYGTRDPQPQLGHHEELRTVRQERYHIYSLSHLKVIEQVLAFVNELMNQGRPLPCSPS